MKKRVDDSSWETCLFYACILIAKTLAMDLLVKFHVFRSKMKINLLKENETRIIVQTTETVERIKRAHLNDIENIPIFIIVAFIHVLTEPNAYTAKLLFRVFTLMRVLHTIVYAIYVLPQPARAIAFITGEMVTWFMIVWSSPEDIEAAIKLKIPGPVLKYDDEHVERVRRAHLNDLENIPMFVFSGFAYVLTEPNLSLALNLFRVYTVARICHTIVYAIYVVPQPARGFFHMVSYFISIYMVFVGLTTFFRP